MYSKDVARNHRAKRFTHAPKAQFVKEAKAFSSEITVTSGGEKKCKELIWGCKH